MTHSFLGELDISARRVVGLGLLAIALAATITGCAGDPPAAGGTGLDGSDSGPIALAAPGRIEGASEALDLGAAMDGIIQAVHVTEGQEVRTGDLLVSLVCDDLRSALESADARAEALRQARVRLLRGSRDEVRRAAEAHRLAAAAEHDRALQRYRRLERLHSSESVVSDEDLDAARRDLDVASSALDAARENEALAKADPLPEETARADAEVVSAERAARQAEARVAKCDVTAPSDGTILRLHLRPGEQVSLALPRPILTLADLSAYRVRAEVDERDIARVSIKQRVRVTADAFGEALEGRVARIEPLMGRKRVRTGDPAEKSDRDIQEVLVDLEETERRLPIGLRVTVQFLREMP